MVDDLLLSFCYPALHSQSDSNLIFRLILQNENIVKIHLLHKLYLHNVKLIQMIIDVVFKTR